MTKKLILITQEYTVDELGQRISKNTEREVFCDLMSISQKEFQSAGILGLKPVHEFRVWLSEYNGEDTCIFDGVRYSVYRTYCPGNGRIELYVEKDVGA